MKRLTPEQKEQQRLLAEDQAAKLKSFSERHGHAPNSRRDFLGSGLIAGLSTMFLPSILELIASEAHAASALTPECSAALQPSGSWIPYIQVVFGGGAAMQASFLQLDKGRNLLSTYNTTGLGLTSNFNVTHEFGNVPFAQIGGKYVGKIMQGLSDVAGATTLAKTSCVKFAVPSVDDRTNNDGIMGLVMAAGRRGVDLPALGTPGGVKAGAFMRATALQGVGDVNSFTNALVPRGSVAKYIADPAKRTSLLKLVNSLSASQRATLDSSPTSQTLGKLMECSTGKNIDMSQVDTSQYDARNDSTVAPIWGLNASSASGLRETLHATVVMNALTGKAAGARIDLTGYDYHGSMRASTDALDLDGGQIVGRVLKTAAALGKPVFVHLTTDGGVETHSDSATSDYGSDAGARGSGAFLVYNPAGRPATTDTQIGQYNAGQAADTTFINTWTVDRCGLAVFANYLQYHKQIGMLDTLAPGQYDAAALKLILKMA